MTKFPYDKKKKTINWRWSIIWPDGVAIGAQSAEQLLRGLGQLQWTPCNVDETKRLLAQRVANLTGVVIDPELPHETFVTEFGRTGLVIVTTPYEKEDY